MLPEDQQTKYKYNLVRQNSADKQIVRATFENQLKLPLEIWERPISEIGVDDRSSGAQRLTDFENEAQFLVTIRHACILRVYDYCSKNGYHYLATEVTGGRSLQELFREKPELLTIPNVLKWSEQLITALDYLHTQSPALTHGEIKPENIILTPDGNVKLLPFGIVARQILTGESRTRHFDAVGLYYSPLEQIWSSLDSASQKTLLRNYDEKSEQILRRPVDAQSDLYALGATLYYLFTHRPPIDALERSIDLLEGKKDPLLVPSALNSAVATEISDLLMKALAIKRENRLASASVMLQIFKNAPAKTQTPSYAVETVSALDSTKIQSTVENPDFQSKASLKPAVKQMPEAHLEARSDKTENLPKDFNIQKLSFEERQIEAAELPAPPKIIKELLPEKIAEEQNVVQVADSKYHSIETKIEDDSANTKDAIAETATSEAAFSASNVAPAVFENVLIAPPKTGGHRTAMVALILMMLLGGSGLAVWKLGFSKPSVMQQTVSAEENTPHFSEQLNSAPSVTETSATSDQKDVPAAEKIEPIAETLESESTQSEVVRESGSSPQISRNKNVILPRNAKQTASPTKAVSEKKKAVTVDDLISDN